MGIRPIYIREGKREDGPGNFTSQLNYQKLLEENYLAYKLEAHNMARDGVMKVWDG